MENYVKIQTEEEIKSLILELIKSKTDLSRKAWLTNAIRDTHEHALDIEEILSRPMQHRYKLGDFITRSHLINAKRELKVLTELRGVKLPADPWISLNLYDNPKLKFKARREIGFREIKVVLLFNPGRGLFYDYVRQAKAVAAELLTPKN